MCNAILAMNYMNYIGYSPVMNELTAGFGS